MFQLRGCLFSKSATASTSRIPSFYHARRLPPSPLCWAKAFTTTPFLCKRKTLYQVLNVSHTADKQEIKSSFYKLSKLHHPDRNPNNESAHQTFLEINDAYSTLMNDVKRKDYDRSLGLRDAPFPRAESGNARTGPRMSSIRRSREKYRPDDWILYRKSASSAHHGKHPYGQRVYNFDEHQAHHYGFAQDPTTSTATDAKSRKEMREAEERRKRVFRNMMAAQALQTRLYMYATLAIFFIGISGYIRLLFV